MSIKVILILAYFLLMLSVVIAQEAMPTITPTETWTPTPTWTATATWTATSTWTATATWTATWTPVVQTVMVTQPPQVITQPPRIIQPPPVVVTSPPVVVIATQAPQRASIPIPTGLPPPTVMTPFFGWRRYQSIHLIEVNGSWPIFNDASASARQYRASDAAGAIARYPFTGEGIRIAYRVHPEGCLFDVLVDNRLLDTLNSFSWEEDWRLAGPYFLSGGYHVLDIRSLGEHSECSVGIDYLEVFSGPPVPENPIGQAIDALSGVTSVPQDVARVVLISEPPTRVPTATPVPPSVIMLTISVAYDANASDTADLDEGVHGVSVRVVNAATGEVLRSGFTDERGGIRFQIVTEDEITAHIPYLGRTFTVRPARGRTTEQRWDVLIPPANQPAVIP